MENQSPENIQPRFKEKPESIKVGDFLKYHSEEGGYFTNQFGFRIDNIPEGTRIKTVGFYTSTGLGMPECEGLVVFKDGKTLFNAESKMGSTAFVLSKFFDKDNIEIISLPN